MEITPEKLSELAQRCNDLALDTRIIAQKELMGALFRAAISDLDPGELRKVLFEYQAKTKFENEVR